jgi:hypothetical protein
MQRTFCAWLRGDGAIVPRNNEAQPGDHRWLTNSLGPSLEPRSGLPDAPALKGLARLRP